MLCSNTGTMRFDGKPAFHIQKDDHPLFLTREDALRHREWLRDEVKRYADSREELRNRTLLYRGIGEWIKPERE